jgi:hypothetical protein
MAGLNFEQAPKTNQKHSYFIFKFKISYIDEYPNDKTVSLMSLILLVDKKTKNQGQNHMAYMEEEGYHIGSASVPLLGDHRSEHWIHVHPSKFSFTSSWGRPLYMFMYKLQDAGLGTCSTQASSSCWASHVMVVDTGD